jgi:glyoxylase-like metal-dependent hydrolase (beta-lactamase superfamily II)
VALTSWPNHPIEKNSMKRLPALIVLGAALGSGVLHAQAPAEVTLTRLECGTNAAPTDVGLRFSDVFAFSGLQVQLTFSCYLIRHGNEYMIWDTGNPATGSPTSPKTNLVDLLAQLKVTPAQVKYVGISHMHADHTGQARLFPQATLLIGKGDWDVLTDPKAASAAPSPFASWIGGGSKVEPLTGDRDVFGDGSVLILNTPGHTPGHHSLLVRLKEMGNVLVTGDLTHFHENYDSNGVPTFNTDRAATLASLARFKAIAANLKATVIIQHDARDVSKLPAFPAAAK